MSSIFGRVRPQRKAGGTWTPNGTLDDAAMTGTAADTRSQTAHSQVALDHADSHGATDSGSPGRLPVRFSAVLYGVYLVPMLLLAAILGVIWRHTPHLPWWDEWANVALVEHANAGTLTWNDFWHLHFYTHRIVLPRALDLTLVELTHWNVQIEMTVDLGIALASAALLFQCVRKTLRSKYATLALVIPLSLLFFSLSQYADWFAPFQVQYILAVLGAVICASVLLDQRAGWRPFVLAVIGALITSLSSLNGLTAWIVFFPSIARMGWRKSLLWIACACSVIIPYSIGYPRQGLPLPIIPRIKYFLNYLGGPVGYPNYRIAVLAGLLAILLLAANMYVYWRTHRSLWGVAAWLELAGFAIATAALTTIGRGGSTPAGGMISRYQMFPALLWLVIFVVTAVNCRDLFQLASLRSTSLRSIRRHLRVTGLSQALVLGSALTLLLACAGTVVANRVGFSEGLHWQESLQNYQTCIVHYRTASDNCLSKWWPLSDKALNLSYAAYLEQHHLAVFYGLNTQKP